MPGKLKDVEIFQSGTRKGKEYTEKDIDAIVDNFRRFSTGPKALLKPTMVIGHEEDQELLDNTGIPKMGKPDRIWKEKIPCKWCQKSGVMHLAEGKVKCPSCQGAGTRTVLKADFSGVPNKIARLIEHGHYDQVSAEIYDEDGLPEGVPAKGKALRRVAILGGELPHVKSLDTVLKITDYSEFGEDVAAKRTISRIGEVKKTSSGCYTAFSETAMPEASMGRDQIIQCLVEKGAVAEQLQNMTDDQLMMVYHMTCEGEAGPEGETPQGETPPLETPAGEKPVGETPSGNHENPETADLQQVKKTPDDREGSKHFADRVKKYMAYGKHKFGDSFDEALQGEEEKEGAKLRKEPGEMKPEPKAEGKHEFSEASVKDLVTRTVEATVAAALAKIDSTLKPATERVDRFFEETRRGTIAKFCENMLAAGKLSPAEMERITDNQGRITKPSVLDRLMRADGSKVIHKFSEKGQTREMTELDLQMQEITDRPAFKFGEKSRGGSAGGAPGKKNGEAEGVTDSDEAKLSEFFDSFSDSFPRQNSKGERFTPKDLVAGYKAAKSHHPELTVQEFLDAA